MAYSAIVGSVLGTRNIWLLDHTALCSVQPHTLGSLSLPQSLPPEKETSHEPQVILWE